MFKWLLTLPRTCGLVMVKKTKEPREFLNGRFLRDEILKRELQPGGHPQLRPECRFLHFHYSRTALAGKSFRLLLSPGGIWLSLLVGFLECNMEVYRSSGTVSFQSGCETWSSPSLTPRFPSKLGTLRNLGIKRPMVQRFLFFMLSGATQGTPFLRRARNLRLLLATRVTRR